MACEVSTTGRRETGVSWLKISKMSSVVFAEVKPFRSSCWSPENSFHFSWIWIFSSFSLYSCLSNEMWPSIFPNNLRDIWYSNSKSDSMSDTTAQKMVASRLRGWLALVGSVETTLSLEDDEDRDLSLEILLWWWWMRSKVALRGTSEERSGSPKRLGTE